MQMIKLSIMLESNQELSGMLNKVMQPFNKFIAGKLVISVMACSLLLTQTALAGNNTPPRTTAEKPPRDGTGGTTAPRGPIIYNSKERTPKSGTGGVTATRGEGVLALMLLAPQTHLGATTSIHPTFAWFVSEKESLPMEFTLWEFDKEGNRKKQIYQEKRETSPGIMKFSLPDNQPGLTVGKRYLWQVKIIKNPNLPGENLISSNEIEIVDTPANLRSELALATDETAKAIIYAKYGMWYDAMGKALAVAPDGKLGEIAAKLVQQLADIDKPQPKGKCEAPQRTPKEQQMCIWSKNLSEIANSQK